ncbi:MAG: hypothetical protein K6F82_05235 [Sphaerochaetaceae bacterium]|nr:hypothetical protein [Sphaerochaetaceae bacterium]
MKKLICIFVVLLLVFPLVASAFMQDISIRVGHGSIVARDGEFGLHVLGGVSLGLTKRVELNLEAMTELVPSPFSEFVCGFEAGLSLIGDRVTGTEYSGSNINTLVSAGFFVTEGFVPTYITLRFTPIATGSPESSQRQSFLPIGIAWNFRENTVSVFVSAIIYDFYVKGSWRDYR